MFRKKTYCKFKGTKPDLIIPIYIDKIDVITQAKKIEANLLTSFTPTKTRIDIKNKNKVPYTRKLLNKEALFSGPENSPKSDK